ncbi:hypothetical protein niasHT_023978 [Heterodera trifolii]|uniref:Metallo-beta-lactamase domain-containing protein 1 n=1 Tax=Heterodera trifolii TaxID=157864 RepID=A0ABD2JVN6_9BILA
MPWPNNRTSLSKNLHFNENAFPSAGFRHRLRDFVGGNGNRRGKGSISRLSFDGTDPLQLPDPDLSTMTQVAEAETKVKLDTPKFQPFKIVMPPNIGKTKNDNRAPKANNSFTSSNDKTPKKLPEDFEKLSQLLQEFINHQDKKPLKKSVQKPLNISKLTADEARKKDEHKEQRPKMKMPKERSNNRTISLLANATRGTVIGTVPLSVEIGNDRDEMEEQQKLTDEMSRVEVIKKVQEEGIDKVDEAEHGKIVDAKSWDGSVEKVTTLKLSTSSSPAPATADRSTSKDDRSIQKQLFGRIIIEEQKPNQTNRKIELNDDEKEQTFFYQVQDNNDGGIGRNANIEILREGYARQLDADYVFVASITLIRDGGKIILVDTGMGTDINGRTDLIRKLSEHQIAPPAVDYVVITHGHPDHAGNTNDFPDAIHFQGVMSHYRTKFNFSNLFENVKHQLTENVALISTPGHTSEDISVVVTNALNYGTVVVAGDVFIAAEDLSRPMMWRPLAWNDEVQSHNRRMILCTADYVVPGHGKMFQVSAPMRMEANCTKTTENK